MQFTVDIPDETAQYLGQTAVELAIKLCIDSVRDYFKEIERAWLEGDGVGEPLGFVGKGKSPLVAQAEPERS